MKFFQRLVLNTEIMRVIIHLTRAAPCLVDCALTKNLTTSDDIKLHASGQDYGVEDGEPYAGFINAGTSLVDVPEGNRFRSVYPVVINATLNLQRICRFTMDHQQSSTFLLMQVIV